MTHPYDLHLGDALAFMATLPDASVDHVITDPPYSEHVHANYRSSETLDRDRYPMTSARRVRDLGFSHITRDVMTAAAQHFARLSRRWVVVFCDAEGAHYWREALTEAGLDYVRTGVWVKPGAAPQFSGDRPGVGFESVVIAHPKGRKRWNGGGKHAVWTHPPVQSANVERVHTTQKPADLMSALVADFTDPGDLILDPFAGSGTTGVAALRGGRRFVGSELSPEYHAVALKRLEAAHAQPRLLELA